MQGADMAQIDQAGAVAAHEIGREHGHQRRLAGGVVDQAEFEQRAVETGARLDPDVVDLERGEPTLTLFGHEGPVLSVALSQDRALVASGGAGTAAHFIQVFRDADVDAALAASVFHSGALAIPQLKRDLRGAGIAVRAAPDARASFPLRRDTA